MYLWSSYCCLHMTWCSQNFLIWVCKIASWNFWILSRQQGLGGDWFLFESCFKNYFWTAEHENEGFWLLNNVIAFCAHPMTLLNFSARTTLIPQCIRMDMAFVRYSTSASIFFSPVAFVVNELFVTQIVQKVFHNCTTLHLLHGWRLFKNPEGSQG